MIFWGFMFFVQRVVQGVGRWGLWHGSRTGKIEDHVGIGKTINILVGSGI